MDSAEAKELKIRGVSYTLTQAPAAEMPEHIYPGRLVWGDLYRAVQNHTLNGMALVLLCPSKIQADRARSAVGGMNDNKKHLNPRWKLPADRRAITSVVPVNPDDRDGPFKLWVRIIPADGDEI